MSRTALGACMALLTVFSTGAVALDLPDCSQIETWAVKADPKATETLTSRLYLPLAAKDEQLIPLFGKSIFEWTRNDYRDFANLTNRCRKEASKRRDRDTRDRITQIARAVSGTQRPVMDLVKSRTQSQEMVDSLLAAEASEERMKSLELATAILQGQDVRRQMGGISRPVQRQLVGLMTATRNLATVDSERLQQTLNRAIAEQQAADAQAAAEAQAAQVAAEQARAEAQATADAELERELPKIDTASEDEAGLNQLQTMLSHPALAQASPGMQKRYRDAVTSKRQAIDSKLQQARAAEAEAIVKGYVAELESFPTREPADLGKLWQRGTEMGNEVRKPGMSSQRDTLNSAFWKRFNGAANEVLPAFEKQLAEFPESQAGLDQLKNAVVERTGIERNMPVMKPYHAAVQARGMAIAQSMERQACAAVLKQADIDTDDAGQPLWGGSKALTLGDFICIVQKRGGQVHEYEDAGLLSDTHQLKLTTAGEGFHTLKLHEGEVRPGEKMLVGFELMDANQQRPLSVSDWEQYVARNTTGNAQDAECDRLANKPRNALSVNESQKLMSCMLKQALPGMFR